MPLTQKREKPSRTGAVKSYHCRRRRKKWGDARLWRKRGAGSAGSGASPAPPSRRRMQPAVAGDARAVPADASPARRRGRAANYFIITLCKEPARSPCPALSVYVRTMGILRKIGKRKTIKIKNKKAALQRCGVCVVFVSLPCLPEIQNRKGGMGEISPFNVIWSHPACAVKPYTHAFLFLFPCSPAL